MPAPRNTVVVEGSLTPAVGHPRRGVKVEVPLTDTVRELEAKGYILIHPSGAVPDSPVAPEPVEAVETAADDSGEDGGDSEPAKK